MSEGGAGFTIGVLFAAISVFMVCVSLDREITPVQFIDASQLCDSNGGLDSISFDTVDFTIKCKDGAYFYDTKNNLSKESKN